MATTDEKDLAGTIDELQAQVAALKGRQDAAEALKNRPPGPSGRPSAFTSAMAERQEQARLARVRAAELADVEAEAAARRDQPRRDKVMKKLAPLEQRMSAIFLEQQALELELQELGRRRIALATELNPPRPTPVAMITGSNQDPVASWQARNPPKRRPFRERAA